MRHEGRRVLSGSLGLFGCNLRVVGVIRWRWVHSLVPSVSSAPLRVVGFILVGVDGFIWVRPGGRRVHSASLVSFGCVLVVLWGSLGSFGCFLEFVGFNSSAPYWSLGSGVHGDAHMLMRERERDNVFYNASSIDKAP